MKLEDVCDLSAGPPLSRFPETEDPSAPLYRIYGVDDAQSDLFGMFIDPGEWQGRFFRTRKPVETLSEGNVVFSITSKEATIVSKNSENMAYPLNYIRLIPNGLLDPAYLVYLLNENPDVRKSMEIKIQGSKNPRLNVQDVRSLEIGKLPPLAKQQQVGKIYLEILHTYALRISRAHKSRKLMLYLMRQLDLDSDGLYND